MYRFFARFLRARTRILLHHHGMRTSLFALFDLGTETFLWPRRHSIQVVPYLIQQFVKHAPGRLDHTLICLTGDVFLQTTGQCTSVFMEASESLCQFVQGSATRARLGRCGGGTCRLPFRSLWKVVFLLRCVLDKLCRTFCIFWSWSFPTVCHWIGHKNTW